MTLSFLLALPALVVPASPEPLALVAAESPAEALFRAGRDLRYAQHWYEATLVYRALIHDFPTSSRVADARYGLASSLEQDQRWDEAAEAYTGFLARHPDQTFWARRRG